MRARWKPVLALCLIVVLASAFAPALGQGRVNMEFKQAPLVDVFQILGQLGGYNVLVDPSVSGEVSFVLHDLPMEEALDLVTRTTGYRYKLMGNTLIIASETRLKSEFGTEDFSFVSLEHVDVEAARNLISLVVPSVKSYVDAELDLVVLFGLTSDLQLAEQVLRQYDRQAKSGVAIPVQAGPQVMTETSPEDNLPQHAANVLHADGIKLLEIVRRHFPHREFGWDESLSKLTGRATAEEWEQVVALLQEYDYPQFVLKGILTNQDQTVILVEYQETTTLLKLGDTLAGWMVSSIADGAVEFTQGQRSFVVRIGR